MASRRIDPKHKESYSSVKYVQVEGLVCTFYKWNQCSVNDKTKFKTRFNYYRH